MSIGLQLHRQQHPALVLCFAKWKTSPKNFQSPRTSTKAPLTPKGALSFFFFLWASVAHQGAPSWR
jgi:hypothetical protein